MMNETGIRLLREYLAELVQETGLCALKTGTEVEDMSFEEIGLLRELTRDIIPLYVKIGGPEARNDIRELSGIGVDALIAPMIESTYSLQKFIFTLRETLIAEEYHRIEKGINIETITGFRAMNDILSLPEANELHQITAARTDMSGSMGLHADSEKVMEICAVITARSRELDLRTSVGGSIHSGISDRIIDFIGPHTLNTRHMVLDCTRISNSSGHCINQCLHFEAELYARLAEIPSPRQEAHRNRAGVIAERLKSVPRSIRISQ